MQKRDGRKKVDEKGLMKGSEGWRDNFEVAVSRPECKTLHISIEVICHFSDKQIILCVSVLNDLIIVRGKDLICCHLLVPKLKILPRFLGH